MDEHREFIVTPKGMAFVAALIVRMRPQDMDDTARSALHNLVRDGYLTLEGDTPALTDKSLKLLE